MIKFRKLVTYFILLSFSSGQLALAQVASKNKEIIKQNFNNQQWGNFELSPKFIKPQIIKEDIFALEANNQKTIYQVLALKESLVIINVATQEKHRIPLATKHVSLSKHYLFVTTCSQGTTEPHGFHVIRMIDIHHYGFKSAIPSFFIPTDPSFGSIQEVVAKHNDNTPFNEEELLLKTANTDNGVTQMAFGDVEDILKAQLIILAIEQATQNPALQEELEPLITTLKQNFESFYSDLHEELKIMGGEKAQNLLTPELRKINWEENFPEDIAQALATLDEKPELVQLKLKYTQRFSTIMTAFYIGYDAAMEKMELTFDIPSSSATQNDSQEDPIQKEARLEEDKKFAVKIILGATGVVAFVALVLPKLLKRPFSQMAADYCVWHYGTLNKSWLRAFISRIRPEYLKNTNWLSWFIRTKLGPQELKFSGLSATADQFKRSFWQVSADTMTVIGAEFMARPWFKKAGEKGSNSAIFIDEPFDKIHSLWIQKNVLYHMLSNQIIGTLGTVAGLAVMEKEYNEIVKEYIVGTDLETKLSLSLNEKQRRQLADTIGNHVKEFQKTITALAEKVDDTERMFLLESNEAKTAIKETTHKLIEEGSKIICPRHGVTETSPVSEWLFMTQKLSEDFERKLNNVAQKTVEDYFQKASQKPGLLKKWLAAFGQAIGRSMEKVLGKRFANGASALAKKTWNQWLYILEPSLWNGLVMQTTFRGSYNLTLWGVNRMISLFFLCPFYIGTYEASKKRFGLESAKAEFIYGLAYGLVTSTVYNYLFVYGYEKPFMGTKLDIEVKPIEAIKKSAQKVKEIIGIQKDDEHPEEKK